MHLPGFTAEQVLQNKSEMIYTGAAIPTIAESQGVVPQIWRCSGNICCNVWTGQCMRCNPWGYCWPILRHPVIA